MSASGRSGIEKEAKSGVEKERMSCIAHLSSWTMDRGLPGPSNPNVTNGLCMKTNATFTLYEHNQLFRPFIPGLSRVRIQPESRIGEKGDMYQGEADMQIAVPQPSCRSTSAPNIAQPQALRLIFLLTTGYKFSDLQ